MNDETFFRLVMEEVIAKFPEKEKIRYNFFIEKLKIMERSENEPLFHHHWCSLGTLMRDTYYLHGYDIRRLVEYCCERLGESKDYIKI